MKRTMRPHAGAILAVFPIILTLSPALGSGTGPGTEKPVMAWEWCMQEATKAAVWYRRLPADQGVADAYRTCRPDFKMVIDTIPEIQGRTAFRRQIEDDHAEWVNFARKMIELGPPYEQ